MNRREFTASLAALAATPALPIGAQAAAAPAAAAIPPGAYGWAQLIARAQNRCDPAMLARHLHLGADAADALFGQMVRDGVLRAPGIAGVAQAAQPIRIPGASPPSLTRGISKLRELIPGQDDAAPSPPLAKAQEPCLGCADATAEDQSDASETQPFQESPAER